MLAGVDRKAMAVLSSGHLATDLAQGALAALLPFLVTRFDLSYALAAALVLAATVSSSVVQPLFGAVSDARGGFWLLPAGVALSGVGMALAAIAPSYWLVALCVLASGLGVAAYHPEGSKLASYASGSRRASGMAFFSIGGNVGFALGPLVASSAVLAWGLDGGLVLAVPALLVAALLLAARPHLTAFVPSVERRSEVRGEPGQPRALALLIGVIALRSVAHMGLFTFVPLWEVARGNGEAHGTRLLALFLLAGAVGTLAGGPLADRFGRRPVLRWSFVVAAPLILVYVLASGLVGEVALVVSGAAVIGTFGVSLVMSQEYMPGRVGMASGLSIGFAIGLGGVAALVLGAVADVVGLEAALLATAAGPAIAFLLTYRLPRAAVRSRRGPEPAAAAI
ncbi:MAG TPA: MFS transporter [Gaiellaceae bacterium]|nr:MFS transporter [Gaiellaceae bacterium]